jgi:hypothetical protein
MSKTTSFKLVLLGQYFHTTPLHLTPFVNRDKIQY